MIVVLFILSCKKSTNDSNILGTWRASSFVFKYSNPNTGTSIDTVLQKTGTITFFKDSTFTSTINPDNYCHLSGTAHLNYIGPLVVGDNRLLNICLGQGFTLMVTYIIINQDDHNLTIENNVIVNGESRDEICNFVR